MSKELLIQVIEEIIQDKFTKNWLFYLLLISFLVVSTFLGSYISSFAKKKGENLATKADIEDIKSQLEATTTLTETIKKEIEHQTWKQQQLELVRRKKLEEYLTLVYEVPNHLHSKMTNSFFDTNEKIDNGLIGKIKMLQKLYFQELSILQLELNVIYSEYINWIADSKLLILKNGMQNEWKSHLIEEHKAFSNKVLVAQSPIESQFLIIANKLNSFNPSAGDENQAG